MKILLHADKDKDQLVRFIGYLRNVFCDVLKDVVLINTSHDREIREWCSKQQDLTCVYFEEDVMCGSMFNQVIEGLSIDDDVLITDHYHIPLCDSYKKLHKILEDVHDAFAVGPLSNTFEYEQHAGWKDAEEALDWSEHTTSIDSEEVLYLQSHVVLFAKSVINGIDTFYDRARDVDNMIVEKCVREHLAHKKMYISKTSGFWDLRGNGTTYPMFADIEMMEQRFGIHYLNVRGNDLLVKMISSCNGFRDDIRILEVGCDCGGNLFRLKKMFKNAKLYGTDINEGALRFASEFAKVKVNNIEDKDLNFEENDFDLIVFGDVLEHLRDPLGTLIYCRKLLKKGGRIATSIPNLMNVSVMRKLLNGDFTYEEYGILDKTHIHMFTYNEIIRMFTNEAGYIIESINMSGELSEDDNNLINELLKLGKAEKFMYQAFQYQLIARID